MNAIDTYIWRPSSVTDAPGIWKLLDDISRFEHRNGVMSLDDVRRQFDDSAINPETDTLIGLTEEGQVIAQARVEAWQTTNEVRASLYGAVHPNHRRRGIGSFLLTWMEACPRQRFVAINGSASGLLQVRREAQVPDCTALYEQFGYHPLRYFYDMQRDLRTGNSSVPSHALYGDLALCNWHPDLDDATLAAWNDSFRDAWDYESTGIESWRRLFADNPDFHPASSFLALYIEEVAGLRLSWVRPEKDRVVCGNQGWVAYLGVRRVWRGRGVATAPLCETMRAYQALGIDFAGLGADADSPTSAHQLYA
jgi:GNAT superfamily N-acetyltransferase